MQVPVSEKSPTGVTIRDQHLRRLQGTYLKREDIEGVFKNHNRKGISFPTPGKLSEHKAADDYDELIAVWTDYFNTKLKTDPPFDPDVFKALLASESGFRLHTPENKIAFGIAQITKQTWTILQDPTITIPMGIRWLMYKSKRAALSANFDSFIVRPIIFGLSHRSIEVHKRERLRAEFLLYLENF